MSRLGSAILFIAVLAIGATALFMGLHAASQPFAIHMALMVLACAAFLFFIWRRAGSSFDPPQG